MEKIRISWIIAGTMLVDNLFHPDKQILTKGKILVKAFIIRDVINLLLMESFKTKAT